MQLELDAPLRGNSLVPTDRRGEVWTHLKSMEWAKDRHADRTIPIGVLDRENFTWLVSTLRANLTLNGMKKFRTEWRDRVMMVGISDYEPSEKELEKSAFYFQVHKSGNGEQFWLKTDTNIFRVLTALPEFRRWRSRDKLSDVEKAKLLVENLELYDRLIPEPVTSRKIPEQEFKILSALLKELLSEGSEFYELNCGPSLRDFRR